MKAQHGQKPWTLREVKQASDSPAPKLAMSSPTAADFVVSAAIAAVMLSYQGCVRAMPPIPPEPSPQDPGPALVPTPTPRQTMTYTIDYGNRTENVTWGQYRVRDLKEIGCSVEKLEKKIIPEDCLTFFRARDRGKIPVKANMSDYNRTSEMQDYADGWLRDSFNHDQRKIAKEKIAEVLDPENSTFTNKLYKEAVDRWIERATDNGEELSKRNLEKAKTEIEGKNARIQNHYGEYIPTGNINDLTEGQMMTLIKVVQKDFFGEEYEFELLPREEFREKLMNVTKMNSWEEVKAFYGFEYTGFTDGAITAVNVNVVSKEAVLHRLFHEFSHRYADMHTNLGRCIATIRHTSSTKFMEIMKGAFYFHEGFAEQNAEGMMRTLGSNHTDLVVCGNTRRYCDGRNIFRRLIGEKGFSIREIDKIIADGVRPVYRVLNEESCYKANTEGKGFDEYLKEM